MTEAAEGLVVKNIAKSFGKRQVVRDVSLSLQRGEVVGLLGPNGAGKTTCFYMIMGLIGADSGSISSFMLLDEPFTGIDPLAISDISELVRYLKQRGLGVLITDHQVRETLQIVDRAYVMYDGDVLFNGTPKDVLKNEDVRRVYLGEQFAA